MQLPRLNLGQSGFSMVSVLIALGLSGILVAVVAKLSSNASKVTRELGMSADVRELGDRVGRYISDRENCLATFGTTSLPNQNVPFSDITTINTLNTDGTIRPRLTTNTLIPGSVGVKLSKIEVTRTADQEMLLVLGFEKDELRVVNRRFEMFAEFDPTTGLITACNKLPGPTPINLCLGMGGDPLNNGVCDFTRLKHSWKIEISADTCGEFAGIWNSSTESCDMTKAREPRLTYTQSGSQTAHSSQKGSSRVGKKTIAVEPGEICQVNKVSRLNGSKDWYTFNRRKDGSAYELTVFKDGKKTAEVGYSCSKVESCNADDKPQWISMYSGKCQNWTAQTDVETKEVTSYTGSVKLRWSCRASNCGDKCDSTTNPPAQGSDQSQLNQTETCRADKDGVIVMPTQFKGEMVPSK